MAVFSARNNSADSGSPVDRKSPAMGVAFAVGMTFENVGYRIGETSVLEDVSFDVPPGEVLCLLGPSGSGKTSLLRIAAGLIEDHSGSVKIDERTISSREVFVPPEKRGVGLVFQDYALFPHLTLRQNVEFGLTALGKQEAQKQAMRVLARVGLDARAEDYPSDLSGGEQQRVALARALAPRPSILLMDEPFSGLDSRLRDRVRKESLELLRETRATTIIVTHDAEEALRVGDQIALIRDGRLVQKGAARELYYHPVDLFAAAFFSEINVLPIIDINGKPNTVFGPVNPLSDGSAPVRAALRLSDIQVREDDGDEAWIQGRISARRFLGTSELLDINLRGMDAPVQVRARSGEIGPDKTMVRVHVDPELIMVFGP